MLPKKVIIKFMFVTIINLLIVTSIFAQNNDSLMEYESFYDICQSTPQKTFYTRNFLEQIPNELIEEASSMLGDRQYSTCWFKAGYAISLSKNSKYIYRLIKFIEDDVSGPVSREEFMALASAHEWIGLLGRQFQNTPDGYEALRYLESVSNPENSEYRKIQWSRPPFETKDQIHRRLSQFVLLGIARIGTDLAGEVIESIENNGNIPKNILDYTKNVFVKEETRLLESKGGMDDR